MSSLNLTITQSGAVARITLTQPEVREAAAAAIECGQLCRNLLGLHTLHAADAGVQRAIEKVVAPQAGATPHERIECGGSAVSERARQRNVGDEQRLQCGRYG